MDVNTLELEINKCCYIHAHSIFCTFKNVVFKS